MNLATIPLTKLFFGIGSLFQNMDICS